MLSNNHYKDITPILISIFIENNKDIQGMRKYTEVSLQKKK